MNSDKLFKIARILDENNLYALADKVDRIAQTSTSGLWYQENPNAAWYDPANWAQHFDAFSGRQTMYDLGRDIRTKRKLNKLRNQNSYGLRNRNQTQQVQQQSQQIQNPLLVSTTPQQLVQNLFDFGRQNGLNNLTQTMDLYSSQGGTYNGQPINQNPQALKVYNQIKNYSGNLTPQQILAMITGVGQ